MVDGSTRRLQSPIISIQSVRKKQSAISSPAAAARVFVHFNSLRYRMASVNKNVLCPYRFSQAVFMTGLNCPGHN